MPKEFVRNIEGGVDPVTPSGLRRAAGVDLITLPPDIEGTNCSNCMFAVRRRTEAAEFWCDHPDVELPISPRMCCARWDNPRVRRPWHVGTRRLPRV